MKTNKTISLCAAIPEQLLTVRPEAERGMPLDDIERVCDQAIATLYLLSGQFLEPAEKLGRYSDQIIFDAITGVQGSIETIRALAVHGYRTTESAKPAGSAQ